MKAIETGSMNTKFSYIRGMDDTYKTVDNPAEGYINEKKSKFFSFIYPVKSANEALERVKELRTKYYDARHVCWAYMLGWEREEFRANDDGEPSGTAGRPILGQINSAELTDVLIAVVRYFGGTLLGTGGLVKAYKEAAADAIANAEVVEDGGRLYRPPFEYPLLNEVIRILKQFDECSGRKFQENCRMRLQVRRSLSDNCRGCCRPSTGSR